MSPAIVAPGTALRTVRLAMEHQKRTEWCWAAVSVSVNKLFRPASTHTQCDLAATVLKLDCCDPETGRRCNHPHTLHTVLGSLHLLAGEPVRKPIAFEEIQKEIDAGRRSACSSDGSTTPVRSAAVGISSQSAATASRLSECSF